MAETEQEKTMRLLKRYSYEQVEHQLTATGGWEEYVEESPSPFFGRSWEPLPKRISMEGYVRIHSLGWDADEFVDEYHRRFDDDLAERKERIRAAKEYAKAHRFDWLKKVFGKEAK